MARDGIVTLYNIDDCKIGKITVDTASTLTYASLIDVPGITEISCSATIVTKDLPGDAKILDVYTKATKWSGSCNHAQVSMPVLEVLLGGTFAASGSTPNETGVYTQLGANVPNYFKIEGQVKYLGGGDAQGGGDFHILFPKCKMTGFSLGTKNEDYATISFTFDAIPTVNGDKSLIITENETAAVIV